MEITRQAIPFLVPGELRGWACSIPKSRPGFAPLLASAKVRSRFAFANTRDELIPLLLGPEHAAAGPGPSPSVASPRSPPPATAHTSTASSTEHHKRDEPSEAATQVLCKAATPKIYVNDGESQAQTHTLPVSAHVPRVGSARRALARHELPLTNTQAAATRDPPRLAR